MTWRREIGARMGSGFGAAARKVVVLLLIAVAALIARAEPAAALGARWQLDIEEIREDARELAHELAAITGIELECVPEIVIATRDEMAESFLEVVIVPAFALQPHRNKDVIQLEMQLTSFVAARHLVAQYNPIRKRILVSAHVFDSVCDEIEVADGQRRDFMILILAHELVHAIQDQRESLAKRAAAVRTATELHSLNRAHEGIAMFFAARLGELRGMDEHVALLSGLHGAATQGSESPKDRSTPSMKDRIRSTYRDGAADVRKRFEVGGADAVWAMYDKPPQVEPPASDDPLAGLFKDLLVGTVGTYRSQEQPLHQIAFQQMVQGMTGKPHITIVTNFKAGRAVMMEDPSKKQVHMISVVEFKDEIKAREYVPIGRSKFDLIRKQTQAAGQYKDVESETIEIDGMTDAVTEAIITRMAHQPKGFGRITLARAGTVTVEILSAGPIEFSASQHRDQIVQLWKRYSELTAAQE